MFPAPALPGTTANFPLSPAQPAAEAWGAPASTTRIPIKRPNRSTGAAYLGRKKHLPDTLVRWLTRARNDPLRPPPRPLGVLDSRRSVSHPGARGAGRGARDAGGRAHRPRLARRRDRPRQGDGQARREAGARLRGLRRRRPPRAAEGVRAPDAPRRDDGGVREPDQAVEPRLPRGLLLQAARRLGAARDARQGARRALRLPLRPRLQGARGGPRRRRRG